MPILGWWFLRREEKFHGARFWVRPMLLELIFALGVPALFWLEVVKFAINTSPLFPGLRPMDAQFESALVAQFAIHVVLLAFMAVATFIDIDEQTIPDAVSVPGTIIAIAVGGGVYVASAAGAAAVGFQSARSAADLVNPLRFDFPLENPFGGGAFLQGWGSLMVGLAIYLGWCFALLPRRWRRGAGAGKAWRVMWRRIAARSEWMWVLPLAIAGTMFIFSAWLRGHEAWHGLMSALIGLAVGAGMIWLIRLIGGAALRQEAVGFGDVTLMAMIGAFLGWQAAIIVFFIAPCVGAVFGILQWLLIRENILPYGPFLCLGALVTMIFWSPLWTQASEMFEVPWLVPSAIVVCLPLLAGLLYGLRLLKIRFGGAGE